jgi:peptidoglycan/xylan/chitin deacetylase (PgdA/CDA1 family)
VRQGDDDEPGDAPVTRAGRASLRATARAVSRFSGGEVVVAFPGPERLVALTFDDGPDQRTTPGLLRVLARHGAHATFFVIGERARAHPDLLEQIAAGGHELGNHLLRDEPSLRLGRSEFERQLHEVDAVLRVHAPVHFFRPGSGWFSPRMLRAGARLGYRCALGSLGLVAARYPRPAALAARMARRCRPGSIVVLHEGSEDRLAVVEVTDRLLTALHQAGLHSTTLSRLAASA